MRHFIKFILLNTHFLKRSHMLQFGLIALCDSCIAIILSSHSLLSWGLFSSFLCVSWILCCFLSWVIPFRDFVMHKNVFSLCLPLTDGLVGYRILVGNNFCLGMSQSFSNTFLLLMMLLRSSFVPSVFHSNVK